MKKKVISALLCMTMVATMVAGCGDKKSSSESDAPKKGSAKDFDWQSCFLSRKSYIYIEITRISANGRMKELLCRYEEVPY